VIGVQLDRGGRGSPPLLRPVGAQVAVGGLHDQRGQPGRPGGQQRPRVGPPFQDGQIGHPQVTGQRGTRQQLPGQILDPHLVLRSQHGQPVRRTDPPVQRRRLRAGRPRVVEDDLQPEQTL